MKSPSARNARCGFTLIESLMSIVLVAITASFLTIAIAFALNSQKEARREQRAARLANEIMETLRATSYDSLVEVERGSIAMEPLSKFHVELLTDIEDQLYHNGFNVYLTIRPYPGRAESKYVYLTICDQDLSPDTPPDQVPPMKILVRQATVVTQQGLNP